MRVELEEKAEKSEEDALDDSTEGAELCPEGTVDCPEDAGYALFILKYRRVSTEFK